MHAHSFEACGAMAPKTLSRIEKISRSRTAGELLGPSKAFKELQEKKKALKVTLASIANQKKKVAREARKLKAKACKTSVNDLMQMLVMKAFVVGEEEKDKDPTASSSASPWIPKDAKEAFDKIHEATTGKDSDVSAFAKELRSTA